MPSPPLSYDADREPSAVRDPIAPPPAGPSVSVIVPSLSGGAALVRLVRSLSSADRQVIVADNGLRDDVRSDLRTAGAVVVAMGRNLGFGAAVNRAARAAEADVLVVLNDDIEPQPGFVDALVAPFAAGADMVAGVLLQKLAPDLIETAGIELDRTLSATDYMHNQPLAHLDMAVTAPFGPSGAAAAYRASAFRAVGGFDESFFAYCEDVDLAIRLRAAGARCALAPRARALHAASGTLGYHSLAKANLVGFSRGCLLRKYRVLSDPRSAPAALAAELVASLLLTRKHRSLQPALARARGWRSCDTRAAPPGASDITVSLHDAWRRRYTRSRMAASTGAP